MRIVRILIGDYRAALPQPIRLGPAEIHTRDFVALRLETDSGLSGDAIGYARGTPLFRALELLTPQLLGQDPLMRTAVLTGVNQRNVPGRPAYSRAVSLIDIACWDILAKQARLPLYQLLGGLRSEAPVTAVAGYYMDRRPVADIAAEVAGRLDEGFPRVKIMLKGDDPAFDLDYVETVARRAPGKLAADAHWSWTTVTDALRFCRRLDPQWLDFLEDPFAAADWPLVSDLKAVCPIPIAMGEDMSGARMFRDVTEVVDILRLDATTSGGLTGAVQAIGLAAAAGRTVFPHVFAPLHVHLACAFANVEGVELIPASTGADPIERLLMNVPEVRDGRMRPGDEPGVGLTVDWSVIEQGGGVTVTAEL
jgi:L-alanine-DL-glutamate epimerase-like enolase superfamily enzyme